MLFFYKTTYMYIINCKIIDQSTKFFGQIYLKVDTGATLDVTKIIGASLLFQTDFPRLLFWLLYYFIIVLIPYINLLNLSWITNIFFWGKSSGKCLYNFDPLKPHFYIVKLGFTGVNIIFLISAQNIDCGYSLEPPRRGGSKEYHNLCFEQKYEKYPIFYLKIFIKFCWWWNFLYIWIGLFS